MGEFDEILKNPAFDDLSAEERAYYVNLAERVKGKPIAQGAVIMGAGLLKRPKGVNPSAGQLKRITDAIVDGLESPEKERFAKILSIMN